MGRCLRFVQPIVFCAGTLLLLAGTCVRNLNAQDARPIPAPSMPHPGIPEDWSNQHVIYTRNGSFEDMVKVRDDPRFLNSLLRQQRASTRLNEARSSEAGLDEEPAGDESSKTDAPSVTGPCPSVRATQQAVAWRLAKARQNTPLTQAHRPVVAILSCTRLNRIRKWAPRPIWSA